MTTRQAIEIGGLTKSDGEHAVLKGVDLSVPSGTIVALLGSNGAGKTTAVKILSTLLRADARKHLPVRYTRTSVRPSPVTRHRRRLRHGERVAAGDEFELVHGSVDERKRTSASCSKSVSVTDALSANRWDTGTTSTRGSSKSTVTSRWSCGIGARASATSSRWSNSATCGSSHARCSLCRTA